MDRKQTFAVRIPVRASDLVLPGDLALADGDTGLVIFAHGSGSSRMSPRNKAVAKALAKAGLATLLFDLLTEKEAAKRANVFDIPLLAARVRDAVDWAGMEARLAGLPIGLFGASTGAAAALVAAADRAQDVDAVVSRGGRPDLAGDTLERVAAPTLLIAGGRDDVVIALNEMAFDQLRCEKRLDIVKGATHLFEEPGTLEEVMELAADWFIAHLGRRP
ncbi:dienelactone hydrolase family protein [Sagittula salina]|uniref:Dienelactone hydrolase family protein n=1 Tax=Sagittula salina TaxID=2820268 RepID=A0A940MFV4_9RHOB|nr:alpha/beta family hydrolase [Sagittula salina]MBP0480895.1 dienelactone hydrolase family protein [Sagittula salina]